MTNSNIFKVWYCHFLTPWKLINFYGLFFGVTVFFGGLGIIYSIWQQCHSNLPNWWNVAEEIMSYSLAILFPSIINIYADEDGDRNGKNIWTPIVFIAVPVFLIIFAFDTKCWIFPIICLFLSLSAWILGNYNNKMFYPDTLEKEVSDNVNDIQNSLDEDE